MRNRSIFRIEGLRSPLVVAWLFALLLVGCSQTTDVEHIAKAKAFESSGELRSAVIEYKSALSLNNSSAESRFALGRIYAQLGDIENSKKELTKARELNYRVDDVDVMMAELYLLEGKYKKVIDEFSPENISEPELKAELLAFRGLAYLGLGDAVDSESEFDSALAVFPRSEYALYGQAKRFLLLGQFQQAKERIQQALNIAPGYQQGHLLRGDIALAASDLSEAEEAYKLVIANEPAKALTRMGLEANFGLLKTYVSQSNFDAAAGVADYLAKVVPGHVVPWYFKGLIAYQKKQYDVAEENLLRAIKILPTHKPSYLLLGAVNFAQGELEQADNYLSSYLASEPANVRARKLLAATRMRLSRPDLAMDVLGPLLGESSQDIQTLVMAGSASVRSGDFQIGTAYLKKAIESAPENAEVRTELALAYLAESRIDQALKELKIASAQQGDEGSKKRAEILLVFTYLKNDDTASALASATEFEKKFPRDPVAHNLLGVVYDHMGKEVEARKAFEAALELKQDYVPSLVNLARIEQRAGKLKKASERYESILLIDRDNASVMMQLAGIAEKLGDIKQSVSWLKEAIKADGEAIFPRLVLANHYLRSGDVDQAERLAKEANRVAPDSPSVLAMLGMVYAAEGKSDQALSAFNKLLEKEPGNYVVHYQSALVYARKGDAGQARSSLRKALKLKADYLPAAVLLARFELNEGNISKARTVVEAVKKAKPDSLPAYVMEADLLVGEGRYKKAVSLYRKALNLKEHASLILKIARTYTLAGENDEAIKIMSSWVADHADSYQVRMRLAGEYQKSGKEKEAISHYEAIIGHYPNDVVALNNLAWLYLMVGDEAALSVGQKAAELEPENASVLDTYGWILAKYGELDRAEVLLAKALKLAPDIADIKYHYADVLVELGKDKEAREILQNLLENPEGLSAGVDGVKGLLGRL